MLWNKKNPVDVINEYTLSECYDLNEHCFIPSDSLDTYYHERFPNNKVDKYYVAQKKK